MGIDDRYRAEKLRGAVASLTSDQIPRIQDRLRAAFVYNLSLLTPEHFEVRRAAPNSRRSWVR